jgi:hypothetical protein
MSTAAAPMTAAVKFGYQHPAYLHAQSTCSSASCARRDTPVPYSKPASAGSPRALNSNRAATTLRTRPGVGATRSAVAASGLTMRPVAQRALMKSPCTGLTGLARSQRLGSTCCAGRHERARFLFHRGAGRRKEHAEALAARVIGRAPSSSTQRSGSDPPCRAAWQDGHVTRARAGGTA